MPFKKYASKRSVVRKPTKRVYKKKTVTSAVKQYVSRTLSRNEETKFVSIQYTYTRFNSQIISPADVITIMPALTQSLTQDGRIGNSIRPIRLEITGYVCYDAVSAASNTDARMLGARLLVYQDKSNRAVENSVLNYNLITLGGSSNNFTGTAMNYLSPHNNDQFTFFADRKMIILKPFGVTNSPVPSASVSITGMDKSMFHPFKIVLTKKQLPAVLKYDQTDNNAYPTNFNPKLALGYCDLFNNVPDIASTQLGMSFCCTLYFKDG